VDEDILFRVTPVDEPVARLHIEPLDCAGHFGGNDLFGGFLFDVSPSLGLFWLGLRVSHDGNVVLMLTSFVPRLFLRWRLTS